MVGHIAAQTGCSTADLFIPGTTTLRGALPKELEPRIGDAAC